MAAVLAFFRFGCDMISCFVGCTTYEQLMLVLHLIVSDLRTEVALAVRVFDKKSSLVLVVWPPKTGSRARLAVEKAPLACHPCSYNPPNPYFYSTKETQNKSKSIVAYPISYFLAPLHSIWRYSSGRRRCSTRTTTTHKPVEYRYPIDTMLLLLRPTRQNDTA